MSIWRRHILYESARVRFPQSHLCLSAVIRCILVAHQRTGGCYQDGKAGGKIALRVCVNEQYLLAVHGKPDAQVDRRSGLSHAAFLVADGDGFAVAHSAYLLSFRFIAARCGYVMCFICPRHPKHNGKSSGARLLTKSIGISPLPGSPPAP